MQKKEKIKEQKLLFADTIANNGISISEFENMSKEDLVYFFSNKLNVKELKDNHKRLETLVEDRTRQLKIVNKELENEIDKTKISQKEVLSLLEKEMELNKMKSKFISIASHEFKTPLTTILSSTDLIDFFYQENDKTSVEKHINKIRATVDYLDSLINDVLLLNRAETSKLEFNPEKTKVVEVIEGIIKSFEDDDANNCNIILNLQIDKNKVYTVDKKLIEVSLINLISNAIKYSNDGGNININIFEKNSLLNFEIIDNGIGIPESELNQIFDQFYRGSNSTFVSGSGLGLSIVKKAAELQGGKIKVESKIGRGTNISYIIPS